MRDKVALYRSEVSFTSLAILFFVGASAGQDGAKKEMTLLEGEWSMVSGEANGQSMAKETVETGKRLAKGGETTITIGGQLYFKAKFTIDPTKKPKAIDYAMTAGPTKGKTHLGIYELNGDTVKFCFAAPGKDRPTEFSAKEGSQRTLSVWKRVGGEKIDSEEALAKAARELQGVWTVVGLVRNGEKIPDHEKLNITWTFTDKTLITRAADEKPQFGQVRLDPRCNPKVLDVAESDEDFQDPAKVIEAVYALKGDVLTVCVTFDGDMPARGNRPTALESKAGSSNALMTLKREKR